MVFTLDTRKHRITECAEWWIYLKLNRCFWSNNGLRGEYILNKGFFFVCFFGGIIRCRVTFAWGWEHICLQPILPSAADQGLPFLHLHRYWRRWIGEGRSVPLWSTPSCVVSWRHLSRPRAEPSPSRASCPAQETRYHFSLLFSY